MFSHLSSENKDSQPYSNHTSMASRLDNANDEDDDDDDEDGDDDSDSDSDSDSDGPRTSSFANNIRDTTSNAHIASEQDENDVEMKMASDSNNDANNEEEDIGGDEKQAALNDERGKSQGSEMKVEDY